jgi:integrase
MVPELPSFVVEALRDAMAKGSHHSPFCFVTKTGDHISKKNLRRRVFRPILKSIKALSQRLGHSTIELTLRDYLHHLPDADDSLAGMAVKLFA